MQKFQNHELALGSGRVKCFVQFFATKISLWKIDIRKSNFEKTSLRCHAMLFGLTNERFAHAEGAVNFNSKGTFINIHQF